MLPSVIVTDVGFKVPWYKEMVAQSWSWLSHIREMMKKKLTQKSTEHSIFLRFNGVFEYPLGEVTPQMTGLTADQQIIRDVLGKQYRQIYS